MSNVALFTDADTTLYDTDSVFAKAQLGMLEDVEKACECRIAGDDATRLAFVRKIDQAIAAGHPQDLRYPPSLLAGSLDRAVRGDNWRRASEYMMFHNTGQSDPRFAEIGQAYVARLGETPELRAGVRDGLEAIADLGVPVTVVTEGKVERCETILRQHNLRSLVGIIVSAPKNVALFRKMRASTSAVHVFMVGDQLDRDIQFAEPAGFTTFYFPGGFAPAWAANLNARPNHVIANYLELVPHLQRAVDLLPEVGIGR